MIEVMNSLFHIAKTKDWNTAQKSGFYAISTLNKSLGEVGFIHLSFADQVKEVADSIYKDENSLVLLKISPDKLISKVVIEAVSGSDKKFPHLYGALNIDAVELVTKFQKLKEGFFPEIAD